MPAGPVTIDPGDALPATFTATVNLGTPPFTYDVTMAPSEAESGIALVLSGADNEIANLDSTNARPGFSGQILLTVDVTDSAAPVAGARTSDYYDITINGVVLSWDIAPTWAIGNMEQNATSGTSATLTVVSGGTGPFTYDFDWAGSPPDPGLTIVQGGGPTDNSIEITTSGTIDPGFYSSTIRGTAIDANGYRTDLNVEFSLTVLGMRGWSWSNSPLEEQIEEPNAGVVTSSVVDGVGGVAPYSYLMFWRKQADSFGIIVSGASSETVAIQTATVGPAVYTGTIAARVTDSVGNQIEVDLPVEIDLLGEPPPVTLGFNGYLTSFFNLNYDWRFDVDNDNAHEDSGTALDEDLVSGGGSSSIADGDVGYETDRALRFIDVSQNGAFNTLVGIAGEITGGHWGVVVRTPPGELTPSGGGALWWAFGDNNINGQFNFQLVGPWTATIVRYQQVDQAGNTFFRLFDLPSGVIDDNAYHKFIVNTEQDGTSPTAYWDGVPMVLSTENYGGLADEDYWIADSPRTANWHVGAAAFGANNWMVGDISRLWISNDTITAEQVAALNSKRTAANSNNP